MLEMTVARKSLKQVRVLEQRVAEPLRVAEDGNGIMQDCRVALEQADDLEGRLALKQPLDVPKREVRVGCLAEKLPERTQESGRDGWGHAGDRSARACRVGKRRGREDRLGVEGARLCSALAHLSNVARGVWTVLGFALTEKEARCARVVVSAEDARFPHLLASRADVGHQRHRFSFSDSTFSDFPIPYMS